MSIRRKILAGVTCAAAAATMASTAAPAHAGVSIPRTLNGGTQVYFEYFASTNKFCVQSYSRVNWAYFTYKPTGARLGVNHTQAIGERYCYSLPAQYENLNVEFSLYSKTSSGAVSKSSGIVNI